jgi:hydroxymethylglutaryl-CoA lyase
MVWRWAEKLQAAGVSHFALSDITGEATPERIALIYSVLKTDFQGRSFALHLHTTADSWHDKVEAAWQNGCRHFDAVINGYGGCPMTGYELLGNLNTALLLEYAENHSIDLKIDRELFREVTIKAISFYQSGIESSL